MNETPEQITARATAEAETVYPDLIWGHSYRGETQLRFHNERMAYIKGVIVEATRDKWIRVEDGLPEKHTYVLVYSEGIDDFKYDIGLLNEDLGWDCFGWNYPVTHWQPLPTLPSK
jgi:hypothetical protein